MEAPITVIDVTRAGDKRSMNVFIVYLVFSDIPHGNFTDSNSRSISHNVSTRGISDKCESGAFN